MDQARPRQVLVTPEVVTATPAEHAGFQHVGPVGLKGIAAAVELSAAVPPGGRNPGR
jgi:class 3 adenylate cyclase